MSTVASWLVRVRNGWSQDVPASIVVFLVSVPMALGIALASGVPASAGLLAAMVGGIVVGVLAGAPLQVTGPSAALAPVVFGLVQNYGFPAVCCFTMGAGVLQIVLGRLRIARVALALSPAVVHGMVGGSGILIALSQIHTVLGGLPASTAWKNLITLPSRFQQIQPSSLLLGGLVIAVMVLWPKLPWKPLRKLPAALVGVAVGTLASIGQDVPRITLPNGFEHWMNHPHLPTVGSWQEWMVATLSLALMASAESLVSALAKDKLQSFARADLDRELMAQGIGNMVCGLLGALPNSGAVARSKANLDAGARTRWATILHGVWLVLLLLLFPRVLTWIPKCVLAGLLFVVGIRLVQTKTIRALFAHKEGMVYCITVAGVIIVNLLVGILLGIGLAVIRLLRRLSHVYFRVEQRGSTWWILLGGPLTFLSVPRMAAQLAQVPSGATVHLQIDADWVDHAVLDALQVFQERHEQAGGQVTLRWSSKDTP